MVAITIIPILELHPSSSLQSSLFNSNKQDPWHHAEPKDEEVDQDEIDDLAKNLNEFRKGIKGDFALKVTKLNTLTKGLLVQK